jgi:hypothetical protein
MRNRRYYGKGTVIWGLPLTAALTIPKDFDSAGPLDSDLSWIHRRTKDADFYFIANHTDRPFDGQARFRTTGREAELWHPDTGATEPAAYSIDADRTTVPLHLTPRQSVFVVFEKPTTQPTRSLPQRTFDTLATLNGPWHITFPPNLGAPPSIDLPELKSWTVAADPGVKYFSGTATYELKFPAPTSEGRMLLDLGGANDLAEVKLNGKDLGVLWKPPYRIDVTDAIKRGDNQLQIKVTNQWTNRIAGDRLLPTEKRILAPVQTRPGFAGPNLPLPDSGLLGPVQLLSAPTR